MKTAIYLFAFLLVLNFHTRGQSWEWLRTSTTTSGGWPKPAAITCDASGGVIVTGNFDGTVKFGNFIVSAVSSDNDIFTVKYDSNGNPLWAKKSGNSNALNYDYSAGVCTDDNNNSYTSGHGLNNTSVSRVNIIKRDSNGGIVWGYFFEGGANSKCTTISMDKSANFYIAGTMDGTAYFGGKTVSGGAMYIAKYDSSAKGIWARSFGTGFNASNWNFKVHADNFGNVYLTGWLLYGQVTINSTVIDKGYFLMKYDSSGNFKWLKTIPYGYAAANGICSDANGNVFVTGTFNKDSVAFDSIVVRQAPYGKGLYIAKYDSSGKILWVSQSTGGSQYGGADVYGICTDKSGNAYITGNIYNKVIFSTDTLDSYYFNIYAAKFDSSGNAKWGIGARTFDEPPSGIACDKNDNIYITGFTYDKTIFGSDTILTTGYKMYLAKIGSSLPANIDNYSDNDSFQIYPNPATGHINFNKNIMDAEVVIYDMLGKEMLRKKLTGNRMEIAKGSLGCGVYLVIVRNNERQYIQKLIVE